MLDEHAHGQAPQLQSQLQLLHVQTPQMHVPQLHVHSLASQINVSTVTVFFMSFIFHDLLNVVGLTKNLSMSEL